jgi:hypothetical protein
VRGSARTADIAEKTLDDGRRADPRRRECWPWLSRHRRWTFHFTPTSASRLNAVENFFSKMTRQRIRRGVFHR